MVTQRVSEARGRRALACTLNVDVAHAACGTRVRSHKNTDSAFGHHGHHLGVFYRAPLKRGALHVKRQEQALLCFFCTICLRTTLRRKRSTYAPETRAYAPTTHITSSSPALPIQPARTMAFCCWFFTHLSPVLDGLSFLLCHEGTMTFPNLNPACIHTHKAHIKAHTSVEC